MKRTDLDLLHGGIAGKLLLFAMPLAATGMLQQLFNAADIAVVGQFVGKTAMAAVGSDSPVTSLLVTGFLGLSMRANVVIAQSLGQGDEEAIRRSVHTAILFSLMGGVLTALLGKLAAPGLLRLMTVPDTVYPMALSYLRIYFLGLPVIFLYNTESAIFRSLGNTRTPLICLVVSGIANVALNLFFVCVAGMDVDGVALATVLSNLLSSLMLLICLQRCHDVTRLDLSLIRIHGDVFQKILRIGLPVGLQNMVFSISNLSIQSAVNSLGDDVMAASSAAFTIDLLRKKGNGIK